tara:strand:+ start:118 stop:1029 length:912 start_codon:yes stop_codon:yes gene_type:complete
MTNGVTHTSPGEQQVTAATTTPSPSWLTSDIAKELFSVGAGLGLEYLGANDPQVEKAGYQGGIPNYIASRSAIPGTDDPARRPGSSGQRYFTDINYRGPTADTSGLAALNAANPNYELNAMLSGTVGQKTGTNEAIHQANINPNVEPGFFGSAEYRGLPIVGTADMSPRKYFGPGPSSIRIDDAYEAYLIRTGQADKINKNLFQPSGGMMAAGGIAQLNRGSYLNGVSDGMADIIPATIEGNQEARLSDGEFVIPADVVGGLGNGNSSAGAKTLYNMMDRVRMARTGTKKQSAQINPNKMLPV